MSTIKLLTSNSATMKEEIHELNVPKNWTMNKVASITLSQWGCLTTLRPQVASHQWGYFQTMRLHHNSKVAVATCHQWIRIKTRTISYNNIAASQMKFFCKCCSFWSLWISSFYFLELMRWSNGHEPPWIYAWFSELVGHCLFFSYMKNRKKYFECFSGKITGILLTKLANISANW